MQSGNCAISGHYWIIGIFIFFIVIEELCQLKNKNPISFCLSALASVLSCRFFYHKFFQIRIYNGFYYNVDTA